MIIRQTNRNVNHAFDQMFNAFPASWGKDSKAESSIPAVNIYETEEAFLIELNSAGRNKEDFNISIEKGVLTISCKQKPAEENEQYKTVRREFGYNDFERSFTVDEKINADGIEARYENGILKVILPKKEEVKFSPKQIQVQ